MEESICHEMVIYLSQRFSSMLLFFPTFSLVLNARNVKDGLKNYAWHDSINCAMIQYDIKHKRMII